MFPLHNGRKSRFFPLNGDTVALQSQADKREEAGQDGQHSAYFRFQGQDRDRADRLTRLWMKSRRDEVDLILFLPSLAAVRQRVRCVLSTDETSDE